MKSKSEKQVLREFGMIMSFMISFIFAFILPFLRKVEPPLWPLWISAIFIVFVLFFPMGLRSPYREWMRLGHFIGRIQSLILLWFVFYFIFVPFGFILLLFRYDPMHKTYDKKVFSYRKNSDKKSMARMEVPY